MKKRSIAIVLVLVLALLSCSSLNNLDLSGFSMPGSNKGLDDSTITAGIKEALNTGTKAAVKLVAVNNGFYGNASIKIPLPNDLAEVEKKLRQFGFGNKVDEYIEKMNRAAEQASSQAVDIFYKAVTDMTLADVRSIWKGADNAATLYFEQKTRSSLYNAFYPVIEKTMKDTGVTSAFQFLQNTYNSLPGVKKINFDMIQYIDNKALDGLFKMLAAEEKKIRTDPAARVTDLLKKVFG